MTPDHLKHDPDRCATYSLADEIEEAHWLWTRDFHTAHPREIPTNPQQVHGVVRLAPHRRPPVGWSS